MAGSFALSVILFLCFSVLIDFMRHALTPLRPYTPDLSIVSQDNACSIPVSLEDEIAAHPAVKRVYGRSFAYSLPASFDGQTAVINLVSYETYQFGWAESALLEGSLEAAERGNGVLVEYNASCPVSVGDIMEIETSDGTHQIPVAGLLSYTPFSKVEGEENVICSEALFQKFTGERRYTIIDIQLTRDASDQDVEELRAMTDSNMTFSDQRMSNNEVRGAYYSFSMFVYGFLAIIALIAVFNVVNGIAMSVSARMKEYGAMRAIGMSPGQLTRMIAAETAIYVGGGVFIGCAAGLPLNWLLYNSAISSRWGTPWPLPAISLLVILAFVILAAVVAVVGPSRRLKEMSAADTVNRE